ncbi:MAG: aa3-type cytochrome c oxidase subunit IV [Pararhodobacter sp.]
MAKHEHGSMDISEQTKTFNGFIRWSIIVAAVSIGILIFLALVNA